MQKIEFTNNCGCIVDDNLLSEAVRHIFPNFKKNQRKITVSGKRPTPTISINGKSYFVSRLIAQRVWPKEMKKDTVVHHKDKNPLNNHIDNLEVMLTCLHTLLHSDDRTKANPAVFIPVQVYPVTRETLKKVAKKRRIPMSVLVEELAISAHKRSFPDEKNALQK